MLTVWEREPGHNEAGWSHNGEVAALSLTNVTPCMTSFILCLPFARTWPPGTGVQSSLPPLLTPHLVPDQKVWQL